MVVPQVFPTFVMFEGDNHDVDYTDDNAGGNDGENVSGEK